MYDVLNFLCVCTLLLATQEVRMTSPAQPLLDEETLSRFVGGRVQGSIHVRDRVIAPETYAGEITEFILTPHRLEIGLVSESGLDRRWFSTRNATCGWISDTQLVINKPGNPPTTLQCVLELPPRR